MPVKLPRASRGRVPPHADLLRVLLADSESGILLVDPQGRVATLNAAAAGLLGTTPARARGRAASDLLRTVVAGDDPVREAFRRAGTDREAVLAARSGAELPVLLRSFRIGSPPWVVLTLRDQARIRRLEHELRRHERLATLGQLSAGVAHEIRNPLAGIGTSAQVLLRRFEPRDERARFVSVILEEVARLDRIVTSLLQYARPRTPELKPVHLGPCIERVIELTSESAAQAHLDVQVSVAPRLGPVYIDPDLVTQVLLNVTLNAIHSMPETGTLRYELRRVRRKAPPRGAGRRADDGPRGGSARTAPWIAYQQLRVIDTGVGIPRHALNKLFDPFFSTKPTGTGLGLAISQSIMQEHGGTITVASREGRGTTVLLNFPTEKRHGQRRQHDPDADA
jgi:two-component system sensor histidine kinase HydH